MTGVVWATGTTVGNARPLPSVGSSGPGPQERERFGGVVTVHVQGRTWAAAGSNQLDSRL
jgi:hypothetical protein